ncbi:MAG: biotin/lipoyl-binding protein [Rhodothermales bacterium]|nr:biotin/lipoyl-binding protein [Rhodothermales bacterium]
MRKYRAIVNDNQFDFDIGDKGVFVDGEELSCDIVTLGPGRVHILINGVGYSAFALESNDVVDVSVNGESAGVSIKTERDLLLEKYNLSSADSSAHSNLKAPMPGLVVRVDVDLGDTVGKGDPLLVLEAMKMENELRAPAAGVVSAVHVSQHDAVAKNQLLIELDTAE